MCQSLHNPCHNPIQHHFYWHYFTTSYHPKFCYISHPTILATILQPHLHCHYLPISSSLSHPLSHHPSNTRKIHHYAVRSHMFCISVIKYTPSTEVLIHSLIFISLITPYHLNDNQWLQLRPSTSRSPPRQHYDTTRSPPQLLAINRSTTWATDIIDNIVLLLPKHVDGPRTCVTVMHHLF